jgi:putative ABC transport system permease protein
MLTVAIKNLLHDKTRFAIALVGVTFAVVLISAQAGIFLALMDSSATIIQNTDADIWVTSKNSRNFDFSQPFPENKIHRVLSTPGVASAEKFFLGWWVIRLPDGGSEQVEIIGYNPDTGMGGPWRMREGRIDQVKGGMHAIMDESSMRRLGPFRVGDYRELVNRRVKIVGISEGARSFTTAPFVFVSYKTAQQIVSYFPPESTVFILARVTPGADPRAVASEIRRNVDYVDVYTKDEYARKTKLYWMVETGIGFGFLLTMLMGFLVGIVIVGQTIYSSTIAHLKEFGTLKAIGASNRHIYQIILHQALTNAVVGFIVGAVVTLLAKGVLEGMGMTMLLPPRILTAIFGVTLLMCLLAAFISIWRTMQLEPAEVFR